MSSISKIPIEIENSQSLVEESLGVIIKSKSNTIRNLIRKLFSTSASTLSLGIIGLLGYAIYRSYKPSKSNDGTNKNITLSDYVEPDIGKLKRPKEQIEEVKL